MRLNPIGGIDSTPHGTVFGAFQGADVADNQFAGIDTNTHGQLRQLALALLTIEFQECQLHRERTRHGALGVVRSGQGGAKKGQDAVSLQLVYGASPTSSGLRMLPLMAGLLAAAIASGRAISRIGRYRAFPIAGTAVLVVGMFLLSLLRVGTAPWVASLYMLVVGIGIGLVMQMVVLVVQNDARADQIGVATSTATFFRSVGGSFGVAIFGTIFATRLGGELAKLPRSVTTKLGSGVHLSPEQARHLPTAVHADFLYAFAHALHGVFLFGMLLAVVPFILSWFLKEVPLRTTLAPAAELSAEQAPAAGTPEERLIA